MKYAEGAVHFVYYLYDDEYEEGPLKVGRSKWPRGRRRSFLSGAGIDTRMRVVGPFEFEEARNLELREIKRLHPPYNKYAASSRGNIGVPMPAHVRKVLHVSRPCQEETKVKISNAHLGYKFSDEARSKMSDSAKKKAPNPAARAKAAKSNTGKKRTPAQRARISAGKTGVLFSEAHKAALKVASRHRWDRKRLLQSGWGNPWRLLGLDSATRAAVEAM